MAPEITSQSAGVMSVLSRFRTWMAWGSQMFFSPGTLFKSSSPEMVGVSPLSVLPEAMVPPVAINNIFFMVTV